MGFDPHENSFPRSCLSSRTSHSYVPSDLELNSVYLCRCHSPSVALLSVHESVLQMRMKAWSECCLIDYRYRAILDSDLKALPHLLELQYDGLHPLRLTVQSQAS